MLTWRRSSVRSPTSPTQSPWAETCRCSSPGCSSSRKPASASPGNARSCPATSPLIRLDWRALERQAREKLASWRSLATRHVADGRKLLGALLEGPIVFTPFEEPEARGYRFRGYAVLTGLVEGVADVVSSPKYAEMWRPHRDSNPGFSLERAAS